MNEKIDILMTTYNTKIDFLNQQIESILKQTYNNFNLIISDDCSTKREVIDILKKYENKDKRIKLYLQKKNLGYNKNFEFLLSKSTQEYIMFSDHDDVWYPNKVEKTFKTLKEKRVDMVYCNCRQIDEKGNILKENYFKYKHVPMIDGKNRLALFRCVGIGCSQMITKKIKDRMLPFKESVIAHDWLASFLAQEEDGMTYIDEPLFGYRLHLTNVFGGRSLSQNLFKWKEKYGNTYESYLKYRNEKVINKAYLFGAKMSLDYAKNEKNKEILKKIIKYYEKLKKANYINFNIIEYFKYLYGKNQFKEMIKEIVIFHLPLLGYFVFKRT